MTRPNPEMQAAIQLIDEAFNRPGWYGSNLLTSLRGLTLQELLFLPTKRAHNAWELALHCAYWKHTVSNRLAPATSSAFALAGGNFFKRDATDGLGQWKKDLGLLKASHARLRATVIALTVKNLDTRLPTSKHTYRRTLFGSAAHDIYHAAQIALLKKLARARLKA